MSGWRGRVVFQEMSRAGHGLGMRCGTQNPLAMMWSSEDAGDVLGIKRHVMYWRFINVFGLVVPLHQECRSTSGIEHASLLTKAYMCKHRLAFL